MSICRWSSDDFQCDLYIYESREGFMVHVAGNRVVFADALPPKVDFRADFTAWCVRNQAVTDLVARSERAKIDLPYAGETLGPYSAVECAEEVRELLALGYRAPADVIEAILDEEEA